MNGLIGRKIGMMQIFLDDGTAIPVTLVAAGPCVVVQKKSVETDGYDAVQLGLVEKISARRVTRPPCFCGENGPSPRRSMDPESVRINPATTPKHVVLPAPLGPMRPQMAPFGTVMSRPLRARTLP